MTTLLDLRNYIRGSLDEYKYRGITDAELNRFINDGILDVSALALCFEETQTLTVTAECQVVAFTGHMVKNVELWIYDEGVFSESRTLLKILPTVMGFAPTYDEHPAHWFQWGGYIVLDPVPATSATYTYELKAIVATYPASTLDTIMAEDGTDLMDETGDALDEESVVPYMNYDTDTIDGFTKVFIESVVDFALAYASIKYGDWMDARLAWNSYIMTLKDHYRNYVDTEVDRCMIKHIPDSVR